MSETTAPLLATRDALVAALAELLGHDGNTKYYDVPGSSRHAAVRYADALLASGVVRDPATLADDEALVEVGRLAFISAPFENSEAEDARAIIAAVAAALTEDPS